MEGGEGHGTGDLGGDGVDIRALLREQLVEYGDALLENGRFGGVHHAVQEGVHLLTLDALQVVAHGHVENKAVGIAQAVQLGQHFAGAPGFHVFLKGLGDRQLCAPLAIVALILRQNAGPVDAGGQLRAVHFLNGFQLEETGTAEIASDDVLGQLGVRPQRGRRVFQWSPRKWAGSCRWDGRGGERRIQNLPGRIPW